MVFSFLRKPQVAAGLLLGGAAALVWIKPAPASSGKLLPPLPEQVGDWQGMPQPVDARALELLETEDVSIVAYRREEEPAVWVSRVAGFGNRASYHPPEICLAGDAYEILERGQVKVPVLGRDRSLVRLLVEQNGQRFETWYWFTAGSRVTSSYWRQQVWMLRDLILRRPISGTLVRISTEVNDPNMAQSRLLQFLDTWWNLT